MQHIYDQISAAIGHAVTGTELVDDAFKDQVLDSTRKFKIKIADGTDGFLLVSGVGNKALIGRGVENIETARNRTTADVAAHILQPMLSDQDHDGLTFALWPAKKPLVCESRLQRFFVNRRFLGDFLNWSNELTVQTLADADQETCLTDLQTLEEDAHFPEAMRRDAATGMKRITSGDWVAQNCLCHSDYWTGNILLPTNPQEPDFYVIDWAGMQHKGYPFFDLARMLMSSRVRTGTAQRHTQKLQSRIGCDKVDVTHYMLASLGHLGRNLEHFPADRYRTMAQRVYEFMKRT